MIRIRKSSLICFQMLKQWFPNNFLNLKLINKQRYAVIVLNRPICLEPNYFKTLWNSARIRHVTDGGANRWLNYLNRCAVNINDLKNPDFLTGDFDSVSPKSMKYLKSIVDINIIKTSDQNETDFTKSLMILKPYLSEQNIKSIIVFLDTSGRIDHLLSHINTLFKAHKFLDFIDVLVLSKNSLSWLLQPNIEHTIFIPNEFFEEQYWCSYVPIAGKSTVTTTGLKWDLEESSCEFGGVVSTSNSYSSNIVTIKSDGFLYWSMGLIKDDDLNDDQ